MAILKEILIKVTKVGEVISKTDKLRIIEIIGEEQVEGSKWTNFFKMQGKNDKVDDLAKLSPGMLVSFTLTIDGRKWNDTVFMNLNILNFRIVSKGKKEEEFSGKAKDLASPGPWDSEPEGNKMPDYLPKDNITGTDDGDLPF